MPTRPKGVILLSFDDRFTDGWVKAIPLFAEYGARVTFFVDHFHQLSPQQLDDLHRLAEAGHEIGCHGLTHASAPETIAVLGPERYLAEEIDPAIRSMRAHGFESRSFAYPRSRRTSETDALLWQRFSRLRAGLTSSADAPLPSLEGCLMPMEERATRRLLIGKSIDEAGIQDNQLDALIVRAADTAACVTLYAHAIADRAEHHHISPRRLSHLLQLASHRGMRFECFSKNSLDDQRNDAVGERP